MASQRVPPTQELLLDALEDGSGRTVLELMHTIGRGRSAIDQNLGLLRIAGRIKQRFRPTGKSGNAAYEYYRTDLDAGAV